MSTHHFHRPFQQPTKLRHLSTTNICIYYKHMHSKHFLPLISPHRDSFLRAQILLRASTRSLSCYVLGPAPSTQSARDMFLQVQLEQKPKVLEVLWKACVCTPWAREKARESICRAENHSFLKDALTSPFYTDSGNNTSVRSGPQDPVLGPPLLGYQSHQKVFHRASSQKCTATPVHPLPNQHRFGYPRST